MSSRYISSPYSFPRFSAVEHESSDFCNSEGAKKKGGGGEKIPLEMKYIKSTRARFIDLLRNFFRLVKLFKRELSLINTPTRRNVYYHYLDDAFDTFILKFYF